MRKHVRRWVKLDIMVLILAAAAPPNLAAQPSAQATPAAIPSIYLPLVQGSPSFAGVFDCFETEFNQIWTSEVVTLRPNGTSRYEYGPPAQSTVSGTWGYIQATQTITFTNFRWSSAATQGPDHFSNSQFLPGPGFSIGISCTRRVSTLAAAHNANSV